MKNSKTRVEDLIEGDVIKVQVPVRIVKIGDTKASLGTMNDGSVLKTIGAVIHDGAFIGKDAAMIVSGADKVEVIISGRPTWWQRLTSKFKKVK